MLIYYKCLRVNRWLSKFCTACLRFILRAVAGTEKEQLLVDSQLLSWGL